MQLEDCTAQLSFDNLGCAMHSLINITQPSHITCPCLSLGLAAVRGANECGGGLRLGHFWEGLGVEGVQRMLGRRGPKIEGRK